MATSAVIGYSTGERIILSVVWMDGHRNRLGNKLLSNYNDGIKSADLITAATYGIRVLGDTIEDTEFGNTRVVKEYEVDQPDDVDDRVTQFMNRYRCQFAYIWDEDLDQWLVYDGRGIPTKLTKV